MATKEEAYNECLRLSAKCDTALTGQALGRLHQSIRQRGKKYVYNRLAAMLYDPPFALETNHIYVADKRGTYVAYTTPELHTAGLWDDEIQGSMTPNTTDGELLGGMYFDVNDTTLYIFIQDDNGNARFPTGNEIYSFVFAANDDSQEEEYLVPSQVQYYYPSDDPVGMAQWQFVGNTKTLAMQDGVSYKFKVRQAH